MKVGHFWHCAGVLVGWVLGYPPPSEGEEQRWVLAGVSDNCKKFAGLLLHCILYSFKTEEVINRRVLCKYGMKWELHN